MSSFEAVRIGLGSFALGALFMLFGVGAIGAFLILTGTAVLIGVAYLTARDKYKGARQEAAWRESQRQVAHDECRRAMEALIERSLRSLESMPDKLVAAERYIDQAENDFKERAFSPFWDSMESAATSIACFGEHVQSVTSGLATYDQLVRQLEGVAPKFPVTREAIPTLRNAAETSKRLEQVARLAQRDFEFATIYEQHKTNRILVEGFGTLGQALSNMTSRLETSISSLDVSINRVGAGMIRSLDSIDAELGNIRSDLAHADAQRSVRERRALARLGQIRRRL